MDKYTQNFSIRKVINCENFFSSDYPTLTTEMYVECYNGSKGIITKTDGVNFNLDGYNTDLHAMDIKMYILLDDVENIGSYFDECEYDSIINKWYNSLSISKRSKMPFSYSLIAPIWNDTVKKPAFLWWVLLGDKQPEMADKYHKGYISITKEQIIEIWEKEQEESKKGMVDFELLNTTLSEINIASSMSLQDYNNKYNSSISKEEMDNLSLFLNMIAKSNGFAHKAHKELSQNI